MLLNDQCKQMFRNLGDLNYYVTAPVAQWIARRTSNPEVVGSSPIWGVNFRQGKET